MPCYGYGQESKGDEMRITLIAAVLVLAASVGVAQDHPLDKDKTGLTWILPFAKAQKVAEDGDRILLIKPVAFGTDKAGGW